MTVHAQASRQALSTLRSQTAPARARLRTWALLAGVAGLTLPNPALAYSDASQFDVPVMEAGGGGRFYTGSPAEGYACDSCHTGESGPRVVISGVPERYVPGATYAIRVAWPDSLEHVGAVLELTDERGRGAGSLTLPAEAEHKASELCEPAELGILAAQLYAAEDERSIAAVPDCGATALRVQWTAPRSSAGPVWLAGAVLSSNHDGDMTGDGVTSFAQPLPAFGETLADASAAGSCTLLAARPASPRGPMLLMGLWLALAVRTARRRACAARRRAVKAAQLVLVVGLIGAGCTDEQPLRSAVTFVHGRAVEPWEETLGAAADGGGDGAASDADASDGALPPSATRASSDAPLAEEDSGTTEAGTDREPEPASTPTRVTFRVTTVAQGGRYAPKNIGAIWVEDATGAWVKTLAVWASLRERYLVSYYAANKTRNKVDAVTSATLRAHGAHEVAWDLTDAEGQTVPDGTYRLTVEATDRDAEGQTASVEFEKSTKSQTVMPGDNEYFTDLELRFE